MTEENLQDSLRTFKIRLITIIGGFILSVVTLVCDRIYARIETHLVNVPIITPVGVIEQPIKIEKRLGRLSGYKYNESNQIP